MPPKRGSQKRKATTELPQPTRRSARINPAPETWPDLARRAKERINRYESAVDDSTSPKDDDEKEKRRDDEKLKSCMTALLDWLPEEGRESAARDVLECQRDDQLYDVFQNIRTCLSAMKAAGNSSVYGTAKREGNVELVASTLSESQKPKEQFRTDILRRDDHRCVITKDLDNPIWLEIGQPEDVDNAYIEAAHIIPFCLASWETTRSNTIHNVSQIWEALWRCFPGVRRVGMDTENINDPSNGIALRDDMHKCFGNFRFAFAPTETPHVYDLKTYCGIPKYVKREVAKVGRVTLKQASGAEDVPLSNPVLLDCHWRMAEILNASGMGEEIDKKMREWEDIKIDMRVDCLNQDGSTDVSRYLQAAFWNRVDRSVCSC